jgi:malate synthase
MALIESHPAAYQMEEFSYYLRDRIMGLNLGRWDYMASLADFTFNDPSWVLPDRNTIPLEAPFFQNLRHLLVDVCNKRGMLAIGGMTALYPNKNDEELNRKALAALKKDKDNEAACGFSGAWTGHPKQNQIAIDAFPCPNQLYTIAPLTNKCPDLRLMGEGGQISEDGSRAAIRTIIQYRHGVLNGKGAMLINGYMEDLATDRIYRIMLAQRVQHGYLTERQLTNMFVEETRKLGEEYLVAARCSLSLVQKQKFNPE